MLIYLNVHSMEGACLRYIGVVILLLFNVINNIGYSYGVTPPTISVTNQEVNFIISREDGPIQSYQIVVCLTRLFNTNKIKIIPAFNDYNSSIYVTRVGDINDTQEIISLNIGTGTKTEKDNVMYIDQPLQDGIEYYVFVRVFSSINESVFKDSSLAGPIRAQWEHNITAIAVPVLAIVTILIIVCSLLMVYTLLFAQKVVQAMKPKHIRNPRSRENTVTFKSTVDMEMENKDCDEEKKEEPDMNNAIEISKDL